MPKPVRKYRKSICFQSFGCGGAEVIVLISNSSEGSDDVEGFSAVVDFIIFSLSVVFCLKLYPMFFYFFESSVEISSGKRSLHCLDNAASNLLAICPSFSFRSSS